MPKVHDANLELHPACPRRALDILRSWCGAGYGRKGPF